MDLQLPQPQDVPQATKLHRSTCGATPTRPWAAHLCVAWDHWVHEHTQTHCHRVVGVVSRRLGYVSTFNRLAWVRGIPRGTLSRHSIQREDALEVDHVAARYPVVPARVRSTLSSPGTKSHDRAMHSNVLSLKWNRKCRASVARSPTLTQSFGSSCRA